MRNLYLALCVVGVVVPYAAFLPFLLDHGPDANLFVEEMFETRIAAFFALDVLVASAALTAFVVYESRRLNVRQWWLPILGNLLVGVSLALPLFLYIRSFKESPQR